MVTMSRKLYLISGFVFLCVMVGVFGLNSFVQTPSSFATNITNNITTYINTTYNITNNLTNNISNNFTVSNSTYKCTGTDKLSNVSIINGAITGVCTTDQTGGGSSSIPILVDAKRQPFDINTNNITAWNTTRLNFSVVENTNYSLECRLLYTGNAATTGQALNLSAFFRANNVTISYETWSSATAPVTLSANVFNTSLLGTGSGATVILQNNVKADFQALSSGILAPQIRSELATTNLSTLKQGSTCLLYNMTGRS